MEASTKDLRLRTRELIAATDRGEEVIITFRGERRAKLVGWKPESDAPTRARNPAFGLWRDRTGNVDIELRALREPRKFE